MSTENAVVGCAYNVGGSTHVVVHVEPARTTAEHFRAEQVVSRNERGDLTTWWEDEFLRVAKLIGRQATYDAKGTYMGRFEYTFATSGEPDVVVLDAYMDVGLITKELARSLRTSKVGRAGRMGGAIRAVRRK